MAKAPFFSSGTGCFLWSNFLSPYQHLSRPHPRVVFAALFISIKSLLFTENKKHILWGNSIMLLVKEIKTFPYLFYF